MRTKCGNHSTQPNNFLAVCSSLGEVEKKAGLGLILVYTLPNVKKDKVEGELRVLVSMETKT